ncbi:MAG: NUDIX hydrolase [Pseudomonadota bacterium]|nr:NUDIX hydrolase [Pseudomonadota bacterium]
MSERWKPSVTVAAIVSRTTPSGASEYLLVEEETPAGLRLNNPAGHLELGESPLEAVVREALEETARAFVPQRLLGLYLTRTRHNGDEGDSTYVRFAYLGTVGERDPKRALDRGIVRTLWLGLDELRRSPERQRSPLVLRCIEDAAAGRGLPLDSVVVDPSIFDPGP